MTRLQAQSGSGGFQWNAGAWFGSQVGSTAWMLGVALVLLPDYVRPGVAALLAFLAANGFGCLLYWNKNRILPYPALQWLIGFIAAASLALVVYLNHSGVVDKVDPRLGYGQWGFYFLPMLFVGLMALFHWRERKAAQRRPTGQSE
jgi:hypothetical protein